MAHFYSNENFPLPVVNELRKQGHHVLTIQETGNANQAMADEEVLSFAFQHDRILLTLNRKHFIRLHKKKAKHVGIFFARLIPTSRPLPNGFMNRFKKKQILPAG